MPNISPAMNAVVKTLDQYTPLVCPSKPPQKKARLSNLETTALSPIEGIVDEALGILRKSLKNGEDAPSQLWGTLKVLKEAPSQIIANKACGLWVAYCPSLKGVSRKDRDVLAAALLDKDRIKYLSLDETQELLAAAHRAGFTELEENACGLILEKVPSTFRICRNSGSHDVKEPCDLVVAVRNWARSLLPDGVADSVGEAAGSCSPVFRLCQLTTRATLGFPNRYYKLWHDRGYDAWSTLEKTPPTWAIETVGIITRQLSEACVPLEELVLEVDANYRWAGDRNGYPYDNRGGGWYSEGDKTPCSPGTDGYHMDSEAAKCLAAGLRLPSHLLHFEIDPRVADVDDFELIVKAAGENTTLQALVIQPCLGEDCQGSKLRVLLEALGPNQTLRHLELGHLADGSVEELENLRAYWENHPNLRRMVFYACSNPFASGTSRVWQAPQRHVVTRKEPAPPKC